MPTLLASSKQRKLAHRQLHSRSTQLSSLCDASLCSTCVQGACVDLILRRYGLLAAGLIVPDRLVITVQVGHQYSTISVTAHLVLAADVDDGA